MSAAKELRGTDLQRGLREANQLSFNVVDPNRRVDYVLVRDGRTLRTFGCEEFCSAVLALRTEEEADLWKLTARGTLLRFKHDRKHELSPRGLRPRSFCELSFRWCPLGGRTLGASWSLPLSPFERHSLLYGEKHAARCKDKRNS